MTNQTGLRVSPFLLVGCVLSFLIFWFGRYIQTSSFDLVQHFLLVDEIMKHAAIRPDAFQRMGAMALYPPAAHWMAAVIGWISGSGLVGITIITIASVYLSYLLAILLVGARSPANVLLFALAFLLLRFTRSQIGWEVVANFFYPQVVADVVYFGVLLWVSRNQEDWKQATAFLLTGLLTMWIQPLVAVHILAAGCVLMAFQFWDHWSKKSIHRTMSAAYVALLVVGSIVVVLTNPAFKVMRQISANDGYLLFGYSGIMLVALLCGVVGVFNLRRYQRGRAEYVDVVLGSAVVAAVGLTVLQFALLKLHGDGSAYAVKKHMFIVITLGAMNSVRAVAAYLPANKRRLSPGLVAPILAGFASFFVLKGFNTPVAPIVSALAYANHAATYQLADFAPGNTVSDDSALPLMGNVMISLTAFQHPFDARAISWQGGAAIKEGSKYAMVRRTSYIDKICANRFLETETYVVIDPSCLKRYLPNEPLSFTPGGNGWQYASNGWSQAESWGAWSLGDMGGAVVLSVPVKGAYQLIVDGRAYVTEQHPAQTIIAEVNGTEIATWKFDVAAPAGERTAEIPKDLIQSGSLRIVLKAPGSVSPAQIGQSEDARVLGLGVKMLTLRAAY